MPDLQHVDAKSGSDAITYTAAGDSAGRLDIGNNAEAALSWETFDISAGKSLQILNSTSEYVLVNQVYNGATTIAGSISSFGTAGTVVIINTAGVTISDGASIDAANLMISSSGMSNTSWVDGSLTNTGAANFGVNFAALADDGGSANIAINENLSVTGDLVVRAEGTVTIADGSTAGNVQGTNIYIETDRGTVTASGNSTVNATSKLTIDTAAGGTTGAAVNVKVAATELQTVDAGAGAVTFVASGAITQATSAKTKGGVITIKSDHMVGSSAKPIRIDGTSIDVYGITHGSQTGANIATDNDIYIRATDSSLAIGVLNSDAGNVYISGDQAISDGDSDTATLDVVASTLNVSTTGDTSALGTAISNLQTTGRSNHLHNGHRTSVRREVCIVGKNDLSSSMALC
jgi:filamentous hemagglutinin family protein